MSKSYPVKFHHHSMQEAPAMSGDSTVGQVAKILRACLVDGFGVLNPVTLEWDAAKAWAKATFAVEHKYTLDSVIQCSFADQEDYNGEHRIMSYTATEIWFELDTGIVPSVTPATGSVEIKVAALGWTLSHMDDAEEKMIFTAAGDQGNVHLRIDNSAFSGWSGTYGRVCKVAMVEDVIDIDTFTNIYEHRWPATDRYGTHGWDIVGDKRMFFFFPRYGTGQEFSGFLAGYIDSIRVGDRYHFIMNMLYSTDVNNGNMEWDNESGEYYYSYFARNNSTSQNRIARKHHQLAGSDSWMKRGMGTHGSDTMLFPNPADNGFYMNVQPQVVQESDKTFRGFMPMMIEPLGNNTALYRKNLQNLPEHPGKIFRMLLSTYDRSSSSSDVLVGFDISTVEE